ncbi:heme exporter protein CcmD [Agaribacter marinus]
MLAISLVGLFGSVGAYFMLQQGVKFESVGNFLDMGGRGFFVWLSFGIGVLAMATLLLHSILMNRWVRQTVKSQHKRAQRILDARKKRQQQKEVMNESST